MPGTTFIQAFVNLRWLVMSDMKENGYYMFRCKWKFVQITQSLPVSNAQVKLAQLCGITSLD